MKRYEKMSKEDIIQIIADFAGQADGSAKVALDELTIDVDIKPRFALAKSVEELRGLHREFRSHCNSHEHCFDCKYISGDQYPECFLMYLCEEIEVIE